MAGTAQGTEVMARVACDRDVAKARLAAGLLVVRSVWFPTLAELRAWDQATAPLFLRWQGPFAFEVGPRLVRMEAARFCPVWQGRLVQDGDGTTALRGRVVFPAFAKGLLTLWTGILVLWLAGGLWTWHLDEGDLGFLAWWGVLALGLAATVGLGQHYGGQALRDALPELARVAADPDAGADDWG